MQLAFLENFDHTVAAVIPRYRVHFLCPHPPYGFCQAIGRAYRPSWHRISANNKGVAMTFIIVCCCINILRPPYSLISGKFFVFCNNEIIELNPAT